MALVGLENLVYAKMTNETTNTYSTPVVIAPAIKASIKPKVSSATLFGDNSAVETSSTVSEIDVEIETTSISLQIMADLLGHTFDSVTGTVKHSNSDIPPYVAIGFKAKKTNGKYRYVWLLKGKFEEISDEYETQEDKVKFQTPKIKATFISRNDYLFKYTADEEEGNVTSTFLSAVYSPTVDLVAPTYTTSPLDNATAVSKTNNLTVTFNKAVDTTTVNSSTLFLLKDSDSTVVPLTITWDTNRTIATLAHAALAATSLYDLVLTTGIKSKDGVSIAANAIVSFTTAA